MKKTTLVKTDDPEKRKFNIVVTGPVEKVANINKSTVNLTGTPGDTLETVVTITPSEKYKFSITGMKQRIDSKVVAKLVAPKDGDKSWKINIKSTSDKIGPLNDILTLQTDSEYMPTLIVRVFTSFLKKENPQSP